MKKKITLILALLLAGCSASTTNIGSLVLPTSNKTIDVVQHRSDSKECAVGWVIQTYAADGLLVDAKSGQGNALHCQILNATIEAGGRVGAGAVTGAASTVIKNVNSQAQGQLQGQQQGQSQSSYNKNDNDNTNVNVNSNDNYNKNYNTNSNKQYNTDITVGGYFHGE